MPTVADVTDFPVCTDDVISLLLVRTVTVPCQREILLFGKFIRVMFFVV